MEIDHADEPAITYVESAGSEESLSEYRRRFEASGCVGRWLGNVCEGGMGAVVKLQAAGGAQGSQEIYRDSFPRTLALKLIKDSLVDQPGIVARFRRELSSHRRLSKELMATRLVPCLAYGESEDARLVYGLFPFFEEGSLSTGLKKGLPVAEALWILADAVEGLQSLHGHRYIHRDFHPSNILIAREGDRRRGVLGDLGVGMFLDPNTIFSSTQLGVELDCQVGHCGYIDPFCRGLPASDLFSVGATLYRILVGLAPDPITKSDGAIRLPSGIDVPQSFQRAVDRVLERLTSPCLTERFGAAPAAREEIVRLAEWVSSPTGLKRQPSVTPFRKPSLRKPSLRKPSSLHPSARGGQHSPVSGSTAVAPMASRRRWMPLLLVAVALIAVLGVAQLEPGSAAALDGVEQALNDPLAGPSVSARSSPTSSAPTSSKKSVSTQASSKPALPKPVSRATPVSQASSFSTPTRPPEKAQAMQKAEKRQVALASDHQQIVVVDALLQRRKVDEAENRLRDLLRTHPADPEVSGRLARLLLLVGGEENLREATGLLAVSLARHPTRGDLRLGLARVWNQRRSLEKALAVLSGAPADGSHQDEIELLTVTLRPIPDQIP